MKKYYLALISILITTISCGQAATMVESLSLLSLYDYRNRVTIGGTFFGNYNADVKTVPLSPDGKCDRTQAGLGTSTTDGSGVFSVTYTRTAQNGGYICVVSTPKADGTSRFFAVSEQKEYPWTGDAYNILVLPEPNTTARSQFNVVSTMFNRMATQKLEKLAEGNQDLSKAGRLLKSANRQIVSQFGLSRGISKSLPAKVTLKDALEKVLYREARASSVESSIPDLNDIVIDFSKKDDPVTLKFTIIIGGIQSLANPNDPSSFDKVVNLISTVVASGNKSADIVFPGGAKLTAGGSFGALVSEKVQTFVQAQGTSLGLSQTEINNIKVEAVALAAAIDNPPIGNTTVERALYSTNLNSYKTGDTISVSPQVTGASNFQITEICVAGNCNPVTTSSSQFLQLSSTTGVFSGTVPADLPGDIAFQVKVSAIRSGTATTGLVNFAFRGKPIITYTGAFVAPLLNTVTSPPALYTISNIPEGTTFTATPSIIGANTTLSATGFPPCVSFNTTTGLISGNVSCVTVDTTAQVTITNDVGSNTYSVKFIPSVVLPLYSTTTVTYKMNETLSINPQITGGSAFQITEICMMGNCQTVTGNTPAAPLNFIQIASSTGSITGTVPSSVPGDVSVQIKISATRNGSATTGTVNILFRGKPSITYSGSGLTQSGATEFTIGPTSSAISYTPSLSGANPTLSATGIPVCVTFNTTTGLISGNLSCVTVITTAQVTITNDIGSNTYAIKFIPTTFTIGGNIAGLNVGGLVLGLNGGNNLSLASGANTFTFPTTVNANSTYSVSVVTQPSGKNCVVSSGTGTATNNVTNVNVSCSNLSNFCTGGAISSINLSGVAFRVHTFTSGGELNCPVAKRSVCS